MTRLNDLIDDAALILSVEEITDNEIGQVIYSGKVYPILALMITHGKLNPASLTFALEAMNNCLDLPLVKRTVLPFLDHEMSIIREGAIYGLCHLTQDLEVRSKMKELLNNDPSPAIRAAAEDFFEDA